MPFCKMRPSAFRVKTNIWFSINCFAPNGRFAHDRSAVHPLCKNGIIGIRLRINIDLAIPCISRYSQLCLQPLHQ
jgi:hypothetical protein